MSLRRSFVLLDENKSNKLKKKQFHKFLEDYRYNLPINFENKLFDIFDTKKSECIDYNEFISQILGTMNDYRRQIALKQVPKENYKEPQEKYIISQFKNFGKVVTFVKYINPYI